MRNRHFQEGKWSSHAQTLLPEQSEDVFVEQLLGLRPVLPGCCKRSASGPSPEECVQFLATPPLAGSSGTLAWPVVGVKSGPSQVC